MYNENNVGQKNSLMPLILILIILIGICAYLLFFKKDDSVNDDQDTSRVESTQQQVVVNKIELVKHVGSDIGDLYLDNNGKIYFKLNDNLKSNYNLNSITTLEQSFNTTINNTYNSETISAILLNKSNVKEINYEKNTNSNYGNFTIMTSQGHTYIIDEQKIINEGNIDMIASSLLKDKEDESKSTEVSSNEVTTEQQLKSWVTEQRSKGVNISEAIYQTLLQKLNTQGKLTIDEMNNIIKTAIKGEDSGSSVGKDGSGSTTSDRGISKKGITTGKKIGDVNGTGTAGSGY